jgi:hypothetical protein
VAPRQSRGATRCLALVNLVYEELKQMARRDLARERTGHTLQTTALVHEAWLKLVDSERVGERGRAVRGTRFPRAVSGIC